MKLRPGDHPWRQCPGCETLRAVSSEPRLQIGWLALDCADPPALARWWQQLLGGEVYRDDEGDLHLHGGPLELLFLPVAEAKVAKNRLHIDLRTSDYDAAVERAIRLGAAPADDIYLGERWRVLRDPEGNEFCIIRPR